MSRADTSLNAEHLYICGNSGTGKSSTIKELITKAGRVIAFDPDDEYGSLPGFKRCERASDLVQLLQDAANRKLKVAFVGEGQAAFEFFAKCAFAWGNCLAIAEEIADVTTPAKAPPAWGKLIRRGRKYGIKICAVTQRPAEADKTILSNAAVIRCMALGRDADRVAIGREIGLPAEAIATLRPLDWFEFHRRDLAVTRGRLGVKKVEKVKN